MFKWREVVQCNDCGKIYPNGTPEICERCGTTIGIPDIFASLLTGKGRLKPVNGKKVIARRILFWWQIKDNETKGDKGGE